MKMTFTGETRRTILDILRRRAPIDCVFYAAAKKVSTGNDRFRTCKIVIRPATRIKDGRLSDEPRPHTLFAARNRLMRELLIWKFEEMRAQNEVRRTSPHTPEFTSAYNRMALCFSRRKDVEDRLLFICAIFEHIESQFVVIG